ncbi:ABC transporter family protein [Brucella neotomae 5K33]|uniref:ABC transporter ATP-binding protein n=1 Tax=Brucella neotomae TaxID=29460 RepID=UPI000500A76D|nr:ATP-binding cassette domain-containing protein [Brucella neotomae]KFJ58338.1 ABC transporter family protein [Brucella neotomae 5K33]
MTKDILVLDQLNKSFGPAHIIRGVNLAVRDGERHAVIDPNGAGKSTLFHLISGNFTPSSGSIRLAVMRRYKVQFTFWRPVSSMRKVTAEVESLLEQVRLTARAYMLASQLSYSEQRSLEIGMTLASDPRLIILDEPMAGMSQEETDYTVGLIREITQNRTLMIVEHDMDVVFTLADRISVLVYGEIIATGTPKEIRENARVREAYLGEEAH